MDEYAYAGRLSLWRLRPPQAMNNLANTYHNFGQFQEAEKLQLVVLEKRRKFLGQLGNAEELQVAAAEKQRKLFGNNHPDTRCYMKNLAQTHKKLDKQTEAQELQRLIIVGSDEEIWEDFEEAIGHSDEE
ncbi:hypothetical protein K438DRAFT_1782418 [Mycena galopus ATCC 62051]|nr:hypothetical protein K438DRAFT_1782418 [Mycena galopus ATCC 62051]